MVARVILALLICVAANPPPLESPSADFLSATGNLLTKDERALLEQRKILVELSAVPGSATKKSVAVALIDAAPDKVFDVLTRYDAFPSFMPMPYCKTT